MSARNDTETAYLRATTEVIGVPALVEEDATGPVAVATDRLVCVVGAAIGRTFALGGESMMIGRGNCAIDLQATDVSRSHARIWRAHGQVFLEDLGSSNGTQVNGVPLSPGAIRLGIGDRIQIASTTLVLTRHDALEQRLQQLKKLDAMGELVKGLAHDFNNMLTVLQAGLDELRESATSDSIQTIEDMDRATTSAAALVRRLLRIGRSKTPSSETFPLAPVVAETLAMARRLKLDRIRVSSRIPGEARVSGSREELAQAFLNLIVNARDAMPNGGDLSITGKIATLDRTSALSLHLESEGSYVDISVADTGAGMDEATLTRIFEPFFTTKAVGKGSGLGLAMVYSTMRNHRGAIYAESAPGRGTTFRVLIPIAA